VSPDDFQPRLQAALRQATAALLAERDPGGHWTGELSSSALSTATAVTTLALRDRTGETTHADRIRAGLAWLAEHQNADGGWGDTTRSLSNLSTTTLCWAAFGAATKESQPAIERAEDWLRARTGGCGPDQLAPAVIARYGKDRTFSVPILTMCALAGRLGAGHEAWRHVIPLPFELAALPHRFFAALRLPVVSYALPALIAIGQVRHHHAPSRNPVARWCRSRARERTLRVLETLQPANGGFLEATPLTSFVTMSLIGMGLAENPVTRRGLDFLVRSQHADGSWPIDTNLSTWVTTLAVNALGARAAGDARETIRRWLLGQQYRDIHPYTQAAPGGWAWTDLPGGVPDADDTSGAMLALRALGPSDEAARAAAAGARWLLGLQNHDGGIPTFCRGWGALPFDRSSPDITAHALRAWDAWKDSFDDCLRQSVRRASRRAVDFLARTQRADGAWTPLWFGNQFGANDENPVYGTSRVVLALSPFDGHAGSGPCRRGCGYLCAAQNADGSWGGDKGIAGTTEETALAVEALAMAARAVPDAETTVGAAAARGAAWLVERVESGAWREPAPIGFYFARLWYYERLYPLIFTVAALRAAAGVQPAVSA
jgi:squalene-hopene/tetraprenyl-beta-curcumene cyclase